MFRVFCKTEKIRNYVVLQAFFEFRTFNSRFVPFFALCTFLSSFLPFIRVSKIVFLEFFYFASLVLPAKSQFRGIENWFRMKFSRILYEGNSSVNPRPPPHTPPQSVGGGGANFVPNGHVSGGCRWDIYRKIVGRRINIFTLQIGNSRTVSDEPVSRFFFIFMDFFIVASRSELSFLLNVFNCRN